MPWMCHFLFVTTPWSIASYSELARTASRIGPGRQQCARSTNLAPGQVDPRRARRSVLPFYRTSWLFPDGMTVRC